MTQQRPNVILITGDHWRGDALACGGAGFLRTPNVDRLAASGVRFCNGSASNPICVPGRAVITTGNPSHICTGNKGNSGGILPGQPRIAAHFAAAGYRTYAMGKMHYLPYVNPRVLNGFEVAELCEEGRVTWQRLQGQPDLWREEYDEYLKTVGWGGYQRAHGIGNNDIRGGASPLPEEHYVDSWVMSRSLHHIEAHCRERPRQPFFMWTSFIKPHPPYDPPRPFDTLYDPREIPQPAGSLADLAGREPSLALRPGNYGWDRMSPQAKQYSRAHYFGLVSFLDKQVGRLLDYLDARGLRENTIVLLTADHGDCLGDHGIFFKTCFLKGSVNIPFIVSAPGQGVPAGATLETPVGQEDALPTLCDLAGVPPPAGICGKSLRGVMSGGGFDRPYYVAETCGQSNMVFDGTWKYIYSELEATEELYCVKDDPDEMRNLAAGDPKRVAAMREVLIQWLKDTGDEQMLGKDGRLARRAFNAAEHRREMSQCLGLRPY